MPLILPGNVATAIGGVYEVANSCRFNDDDSPKLTRTFTETGGTRDSNGTTWTISMWVKRGKLGVEQKLITAYGSNVVVAGHHAGKTLTNTSGGWTFNGSTDFAVGEVMRVVNKSGSSQTVGQASGSTVYSSRDGGTSGDHSIKPRGSAIVICTAADEYYVSGDI